MRVFVASLTAIAFLAILGGRGYLLPLATNSDEFGLTESSSILIERPHYFPPREIHSFACGGALIDTFCWTRDPTFYSSGIKVTTLEKQDRRYEVVSQFIFVNDHFSSEKFKEIVFAVKIDGIEAEFNFEESDKSPQRWTVPELIGTKNDNYCFAYDDNSSEPEASMAAVCISVATKDFHTVQLGPTKSGASFVLDFIGSSKISIYEKFCKGESKNEYLAKLLLGVAC